MYQTTATSSPAWAKTPRQDGPYKLAGHEVSRSLFDAKEAAKRQGRRVFLVLLTEHENEKEVPPGVCLNCFGAESIGIEVVMAGPFKNAPIGQKDEGGSQLLRPAFHNGKWWQVARQFAPCPVCADVREVVL
jgi:hypothetical protein